MPLTPGGAEIPQSCDLVFCWGYNERGQLGNADVASSSTPVATGLGAKALVIGGSGKSAGYGFGCAVLLDGSGRCWGENGLGQTGKGSTSFLESTPVTVQGLSSAFSIAVGGAHACALLSDRSLACWGANIAGQLGDGTTTNRLSVTPVVNLDGVQTFAAADAATCAIDDNKHLFCWGTNGYGQLGDGTIAPRSKPTALLW